MPIHNWTRVTPGIFYHFHHEWISAISRSLNAGLLPPEYYALAEQIASGYGPDVLMLEHLRAQPSRPAGNGAASGKSPGKGGTGLLSAPPRVRYTAAIETEKYAHRRKRIVIRRRGGDEVVAVIEIVSPGNKGSLYALDSFVKKALELLDAGIQLLIIDLFPPGTYDPEGIHGAIWSALGENDFRLPAETPLTLAAYSTGDAMEAFIEPAAIGQALPEMPLFLMPGHYVPLPLEPTYNAAFDAVPKRWRTELEPSA